MPAYAIKAPIADAGAPVFAFEAAKTMYGGKAVAVGDTVYAFLETFFQPEGAPSKP